jgi:DNA-binding Lrp family transcriptional regulator
MLMVMLDKSRDIGWNRLLSNTAKDLLLGLQGEMRWGGQVHMSVNQMADKLGVHRTAASRALAELIANKIIERCELQHDYRFTDEWLHRSRGE